MSLKGISPCINVADMQLARDFYPTYFGAKITFDCGWYINLEFGEGDLSLQFMQPQTDDIKLFSGGTTYNLKLADKAEVDAKHDELVNAGLPIVMPLEDHDWGDRGFCTLDPYGVALYVYVDIEPSEEFKKFYVE